MTNLAGLQIPRDPPTLAKPEDPRGADIPRRKPGDWPPSDESLTWRASSERAELSCGRRRDRIDGDKRDGTEDTGHWAAQITMALAFANVACGSAILIALKQASAPPTWVKSTVAAATTLMFFTAAGLLTKVCAWYIEGRAAFFQRVRYLKGKEVAEALAQLKDSQSLGDLIVLNRRQLDEYHVLSVRQASIAFRNMQVAAGIAFGVLVFGIITSIRQSDATGQVVTASLSGLGTTLSSFVSAVFHRSYQKTMDELRTYYQEPILTSQLLTAERVAGSKLSGRFTSRIVDHLLNKYDHMFAEPPSKDDDVAVSSPSQTEDRSSGSS